MAEKGKKLEIDDRELREITTYEKREKENWPDGRIKWSHDSVFGLDVPERVFREVHIARLTLTLALALTLTLTPTLTLTLTLTLFRLTLTLTPTLSRCTLCGPTSRPRSAGRPEPEP